VHLQPEGENWKAVRTFEKAGGTHLILSHLPYHDLPADASSGYSKQFQRTLDIADLVRKNSNVEVFVTVGPYPVDLIWMAERMELKAASNIMKKGMEQAAKLFADGKIVGMGEIGRPHFPVDEDIMRESNEILSYGMETARDAGCPVVLHTETASPESCRDLAGMADRAGLDLDKVVKHFSPSIILPEENYGLFPSVLATKKNILESVKKGRRFFMETDFLDDPKRPGAVLGIKTVPKRTLAMLESETMTLDDAHAIHVENPAAVYGIDIHL